MIVFKTFRPNRWMDFGLAILSISCGIAFVFSNPNEIWVWESTSISLRGETYWPYIILGLSVIILYIFESRALKSFAPLPMSKTEKAKRPEARLQAVIQAIAERPKAAYWKLWRSWIISISLLSASWAVAFNLSASRFDSIGPSTIWLWISSLQLFVFHIYFLIATFQLFTLWRFSLLKSWLESLAWLSIPIIGYLTGLTISLGFLNNLVWIQNLNGSIKVRLTMSIGVNILAVCLQVLLLNRYLNRKDALIWGTFNLCAVFMSAMVCGYDFWSLFAESSDTSSIIIVSLIGLFFGFSYSTIMGFAFLWILHRTASVEGVNVDFPKISRVFFSSLGLLIFSITAYTQAPSIYAFAQEQLTQSGGDWYNLSRITRNIMRILGR